MNVLLRLYWEFFKTGLFAVGGGMATLPFLQAIGDSTGWYTYADMMNMLAVSESTPGPIGINMATYAGFTAAGVPGALAATLGEITPSIIVILAVATALNKFRTNRYVDWAFYGLRPASTGLIGAACVGVFLEVLTGFRLAGEGLVNRAVLAGERMLNWPHLLLAVVLLLLTQSVPKVRDLHPVAFIGLSAAVGVLFHFAAI